MAVSACGWRVVVCVVVGCVTLALWLASVGAAAASGWAIQPAPAVPSLTSGQFSAVSCTPENACIAVGSYTNKANVALPLAERLNGTGWRILRTPRPAGAKGAALGGVSCAAGNACIAVGSYTNKAKVQVMLAERWSGSGWEILRIPRPAGAASTALSGVSCTSRNACIAVGSYYNSRAKVQVTLVERWDGARWRIRRTPNPAGTVMQHPIGTQGASLSGVSCTSRTACIAVGSYVKPFNPLVQPRQAALVERWNGKLWKIQRTPSPAGASPLTNMSLSSVTCMSRTVCIAVGSYTDSVGTGVALAERFNGERWRIEDTPDPAGATSITLSGVSCSSRMACTTVGSFANPATIEVTFAEAWNGTSWRIQSTRNPLSGASRGALNGVSCTSATACTAVGSHTNTSGTQTALAEGWDGTSWRIQPTPDPGGAGSSALNGVSCASPTACIAVGSYSSSAGTQLALAEAWDGTSWMIQNTPTPTGATSASLSGISCTATTACIAVGTAKASDGDTLTLAEGWDGSSWTTQNTPNPPTEARLDSVSCTSATACTAVGSDGILPYTTLAERWDGGSWTLQNTPNIEPQPGEGTLLDSVSCSSATVCTAVGGWSAYQVSGFVADFWDGTAWTIQSTPSSTSPGGQLNGVSCTSATACTAVGELSSAEGLPAPVADTWDGTSWTLQNTPTPGYTGFNAVSCTSATVCTAVGSYFIERES